MTRSSFNENWTVRIPVGAYAAALGAGRLPEPVTLPHDAVIGLERAAQNGSGPGYFPGGVFEYSKTFDVPEEYRSRRVTLEFEGVYRDAMVFINGEFATQRPFGIRTLQLDPTHELRINGDTVNLRGACVHGDNGILGAAVITRADERRVQRLKEAGFNAIRSSHQPVSRAMLDACDEYGMLVMDEAFDMWTEGKTNFDYSLAFPEWWERDVEAMVHRTSTTPASCSTRSATRSSRLGGRSAIHWAASWRRRCARSTTPAPSPMPSTTFWRCCRT